MNVALVDLGGSVDPGTPVDPGVARDVDRACRELGFLHLIGHGVSREVIDGAFRAARSFFDLDEQQRLRVVAPESGHPYGYRPFRAEALERSLGTDGVVDLKETFNIGPIDPPPRPLDEMDDPDERAVYAPNLWPDESLPHFRPTMERYYRTMAQLAERLMEVFAVALGLPQRHFSTMIDRHGSALRVAHYPALPEPPADGQLRAGAHTDYGTLTILATDGEAGLQVRSAAGEWLDVGHVPGGLVVNLGDLMQRWTNDRWRSTMHRVVVPADGGVTRRISLPFFHNANWDARVECIVAPGERPRHEPVLAGAHLMSKFRSTVTHPPIA